MFVLASCPKCSGQLMCRTCICQGSSPRLLPAFLQLFKMGHFCEWWAWLVIVSYGGDLIHSKLESSRSAYFIWPLYPVWTGAIHLSHHLAFQTRTLWHSFLVKLAVGIWNPSSPPSIVDILTKVQTASCVPQSWNLVRYCLPGTMKIQQPLPIVHRAHPRRGSMGGPTYGFNHDTWNTLSIVHDGRSC